MEDCLLNGVRILGFPSESNSSAFVRDAVVNQDENEPALPAEYGDFCRR